MLCASYSVPTALHIPQIVHVLRYRSKHTENVSVTHAGCIAAAVGRTPFSRFCLFVCLFLCLCVCPRSKMKTAWTINTKLGTHILYSSRMACIDPKVKSQRSRSHGYENRYGRTVASDACCYGRVLLLPACSGWPCPWLCHPFHFPPCFIANYLILLSIHNLNSQYKIINLCAVLG